MSIFRPTRVSLSRNRVVLEIDLTPGATIAPDVIARLDRDGDNAISPIEAAAYGELVLSDLVLTLDERPVTMTLAHAEVAPIDSLRSGIGAIQLRAVGALEPDVTGPRQVYFRNNHQPSMSVYMVNALDSRRPERECDGTKPQCDSAGSAHRLPRRSAMAGANLVAGVRHRRAA